MNAQTLHTIRPEQYDLDDAGCWLWNGAADKWGYGRIKRSGRLWLAHRYSWTLAKGLIPDGMTVDHLCFVPACINPDHLRLLSPLENSRNLRLVTAPTCRNGHVRTPESTAARTDRRGRTFRRCLACERAATSRNQRHLNGSETSSC